MSNCRTSNHLLAALPVADYELLRARTVSLRNGEVLAQPGSQLRLVYFPHNGIISRVVSFARGETIEVGMVGCDGVFDAGAALNCAVASTAAIVRFPGSASVVEAARLRDVIEQSAALRELLGRQQWLQTVHAEQSAACNAWHDVEARLCQRLLWVRDLSGSDLLPLTQEILAEMLGVRRNSVSMVANALQLAGVIHYSRGQIEITDLDGLIARSCECYETIKQQSGLVAGGAAGVLTSHS
jgi:CRP-like cAMP-binding protein